MKKNKKNTLPVAVLTGCCLIGGVIAGRILGHQSMASAAGSSGEKILLLLTAVVSLFVAYMLALIIHEGGHLVFGLLTGYKYLLFRIGSLTLIRRNNRFELKKFAIKGTGGQCILMPPESDDPQKAPFFLYHAGGGIFNLLTALIAFPVASVVGSSVLRTFLLVLGVLSFMLGIMNLIPLKMQVPNDGYNIMMMLKSPAERAAVYKTLKVNGLLFEGKTLSQISPELFELGSEGFYKTVEKIFKGGALIDRLDFEGAERIFAEGAKDETITFYQLECRSELMFCKIMNGAPVEEIDAVYDNELATYISEAGKTIIAKRRQMYAYYLLYKHDMQAAGREYQAAVKLKDTYPFEGEAISELKLIEAVKMRGEDSINASGDMPEGNAAEKIG